MKKYIYLLISMVILASCSSPKYTYYFDHYDYNSGKKKVALKESLVSQEKTETSVPDVNSSISIDEKTIVASAKETEVYIAKPAPVISREEAVARIKSLTKEEKRELKREVKKYVKENKKKDFAEGSGGRAMANDVKLAAIFGVVGIVLLIVGGDVIYVLGAIALLIGLFFLVRWLVRQ